MSNRYQTPGKRRSRAWLWLLLLGIIIGAALLAGTATVMHKTSDTAFCISCHTMEQPLAEYQGSIHFQNTKGIRAECADCHVPHQPIDYLLTKVAALKDVYGEVTGKIDTPEKYEAHKLAMAQSVWDTLKKNDSATCRSCHSYDAMDVIAQKPEARQQHPVAIKNGETCIDCHKGVAHILPDMSGLAAAGASELANAAAKTPDSATTLYTIATEPFYLSADETQHNAGNLMPSTEVKVVKRQGDRVLADVAGWQQDGVTEVFYAAQGKRILSVLVGEDARKQLKTLNTVKDAETGLVWHQVSLQVWLPKKQLVDDQQKIWHYASDMMSANCTGCHGLTALDRFNANQWIGVVKGMAPRTSLTQEQLRVLTQYVQKHASDMPANQSNKI
ncbi:MAG: NapC/NirT family cytochrome c [Enterobacterales bacterium]|uniref:NapC/NirT family cytochrome c n=1 Tax=Hafnia alvei TaxID=569 RepID=UPI000582FA50|nr:NapC/NirT family cytochrome c [Hafnia alvei]KID03321.1 cytochrome C [Hafnia alvei]MDN6019590.1 NapC/NirT family cytochrome c [Enterobacterales bacterium]MDN6110554.1 NapC/NirT family cytochrome c [Enterobacterales bacterium]TBL98249.1 cytochrome C [Hafnia alvei]